MHVNMVQKCLSIVIYFLLTDLVIKNNTLYVLFKEFVSLKNVGSVGPIQNLKILIRIFLQILFVQKVVMI